jgi:hypothetical protein
LGDRGGMTIINNCYGEIDCIELSKSTKKFAGYSGYCQINENPIMCMWDNKIPTMYSKELFSASK